MRLNVVVLAVAKGLAGVDRVLTAGKVANFAFVDNVAVAEAAADVVIVVTGKQLFQME